MSRRKQFLAVMASALNNVWRPATSRCYRSSASFPSVSMMGKQRRRIRGRDWQRYRGARRRSERRGDRAGVRLAWQFSCSIPVEPDTIGQQQSASSRTADGMAASARSGWQRVAVHLAWRPGGSVASSWPDDYTERHEKGRDQNHDCYEHRTRRKAIRNFLSTMKRSHTSRTP